MTHEDLTELQIEISELEKENQELKDRVKDLEVNLTYMATTNG
jgi:FtsZ-binding cell division protein ZapB